MKTWTVWSVVLGVLVGVGPAGPPALAGPQDRLIVTGASSVAPLIGEVAKYFEARHPGIQVDVHTGGSARGIHDVRAGLADIGMVSRPLQPDELEDLRGVVIAHDGIGLIVHASNPVTELSDAQLQGIYTGRLTNWQEVGGRQAPITVVSKAEGRGTLDLFLGYLGLKSAAIRAQVIIGDNGQEIKTVAGNPQAIGYVSVGAAEFSARHGVPIKLLPVRGIPATTAHVRDGTFPLVRPFILVTKAPPAGVVQAFIAFARSEEVHPLVMEQFVVPLSD